MKELNLNEIKKIEIKLLKEFKAYCEEHGLKYFLSNGTLLGAIKYNGFIPWDDDIDVIMPREDYDRFVKEFPSNEKIKLLSDETCNNYIFTFAKLSDSSTLIQNQTTLKGYEYGIHIDIFPLDRWNDDGNIAHKEARRIQKLCQKMCFSISHFSKGRSLFHTCAKNLIIAWTHIIGYTYYRAKLYSIIEKNINYFEGNYSGCLVWPIYGIREIIPTEVFSDVVEVEFEGDKYPAPVGYDVYLRSLYGDYENDPPSKKQKSHHKYKAYKI